MPSSFAVAPAVQPVQGAVVSGVVVVQSNDPRNTSYAADEWLAPTSLTIVPTSRLAWDYNNWTTAVPVNVATSYGDSTLQTSLHTFFDIAVDLGSTTDKQFHNASAIDIPVWIVEPYDRQAPVLAGSWSVSAAQASSGNTFTIRTIDTVTVKMPASDVAVPAAGLGANWTLVSAKLGPAGVVDPALSNFNLSLPTNLTVAAMADASSGLAFQVPGAYHGLSNSFAPGLDVTLRITMFAIGRNDVPSSSAEVVLRIVSGSVALLNYASPIVQAVDDLSLSFKLLDFNRLHAIAPPDVPADLSCACTNVTSGGACLNRTSGAEWQWSGGVVEQPSADDTRVTYAIANEDLQPLGNYHFDCTGSRGTEGRLTPFEYRAGTTSFSVTVARPASEQSPNITGSTSLEGAEPAAAAFPNTFLLNAGEQSRVALLLEDRAQPEADALYVTWEVMGSDLSSPEIGGVAINDTVDPLYLYVPSESEVSTWIVATVHGGDTLQVPARAMPPGLALHLRATVTVANRDDIPVSQANLTLVVTEQGAISMSADLGAGQWDDTAGLDYLATDYEVVFNGQVLDGDGDHVYPDPAPPMRITTVACQDPVTAGQCLDALGNPLQFSSLLESSRFSLADWSLSVYLNSSTPLAIGASYTVRLAVASGFDDALVPYTYRVAFVDKAFAIAPSLKDQVPTLEVARPANAVSIGDLMWKALWSDPRQAFAGSVNGTDNAFPRRGLNASATAVDVVACNSSTCGSYVDPAVLEGGSWALPSVSQVQAWLDQSGPFQVSFPAYGLQPGGGILISMAVDAIDRVDVPPGELSLVVVAEQAPIAAQLSAPTTLPSDSDLLLDVHIRDLDLDFVQADFLPNMTVEWSCVESTGQLCDWVFTNVSKVAVPDSQQPWKARCTAAVEAGTLSSWTNYTVGAHVTYGHAGGLIPYTLRETRVNATVQVLPSRWQQRPNVTVDATGSGIVWVADHDGSIGGIRAFGQLLQPISVEVATIDNSVPASGLALSWTLVNWTAASEDSFGFSVDSDIQSIGAYEPTQSALNSWVVGDGSALLVPAGTLQPGFEASLLLTATVQGRTDIQPVYRQVVLASKQAGVHVAFQNTSGEVFTTGTVSLVAELTDLDGLLRHRSPLAPVNITWSCTGSDGGACSDVNGDLVPVPNATATTFQTSTISSIATVNMTKAVQLETYNWTCSVYAGSTGKDVPFQLRSASASLLVEAVPSIYQQRPVVSVTLPGGDSHAILAAVRTSASATISVAAVDNALPRLGLTYMWSIAGASVAANATGVAVDPSITLAGLAPLPSSSDLASWQELGGGRDLFIPALALRPGLQLDLVLSVAAVNRTDLPATETQVSLVATQAPVGASLEGGSGIKLQSSSISLVATITDYDLNLAQTGAPVTAVWSCGMGSDPDNLATCLDADGLNLTLPTATPAATADAWVTTSTLSIPSNSLKSGATFTFTCQASIGSSGGLLPFALRTAEAVSTTVSIVSPGSPTGSIHLLSGVDARGRVRRHLPIDLGVDIYRDTGLDLVKVTDGTGASSAVDAAEALAAGRLSVSYFVSSRTDQDAAFDGSRHQPRVLLLPYALPASGTTTVRAEVTDLDTNMVGTLYIQLQPNAPPRIASGAETEFAVTPSSGTAGSTKFTVSESGSVWTDDDEDLPLTYGFGYYLDADPEVVEAYWEDPLLNPAPSQAFVPLVNAFTSATNLTSLLFPVGNLTVVLRVADAFGAVKTTTVGVNGTTAEVEAASAPDATLSDPTSFDSLLTQATTDDVDAALEEADNVRAVAGITAVASLVNAAAPAPSDYDSTQSTSGGQCSADSDCPSPPPAGRQLCLAGVCETIPALAPTTRSRWVKRCPGDASLVPGNVASGLPTAAECSGNGQCIRSPAGCLAGVYGCSAKCVCSTGWAGSSCKTSSAIMEVAQKHRTNLVAVHKKILDATLRAVPTSVEALASAALLAAGRDPKQLTTATRSQVRSTVQSLASKLVDEASDDVENAMTAPAASSLLELLTMLARGEEDDDDTTAAARRRELQTATTSMADADNITASANSIVRSMLLGSVAGGPQVKAESESGVSVVGQRLYTLAESDGITARQSLTVADGTQVSLAPSSAGFVDVAMSSWSVTPYAKLDTIADDEYTALLEANDTTAAGLVARRVATASSVVVTNRNTSAVAAVDASRPVILSVLLPDEYAAGDVDGDSGQGTLQCQFLDTTTYEWSSVGAIAIGVDETSGEMLCASTHLTTFSGLISDAIPVLNAVDPINDVGTLSHLLDASGTAAIVLLGCITGVMLVAFAATVWLDRNEQRLLKSLREAHMIRYGETREGVGEEWLDRIEAQRKAIHAKVHQELVQAQAKSSLSAWLARVSNTSVMKLFSAQSFWARAPLHPTLAATPVATPVAGAASSASSQPSLAELNATGIDEEALVKALPEQLRSLKEHAAKHGQAFAVLEYAALAMLVQLRLSHSWLRVFAPPRDSRMTFTRPQRMVVLLGVLLSNMAVTAVFLGTEQQRVSQTVAASVISTAVMLPVSFFIPYAFRYINRLRSATLRSQAERQQHLQEMRRRAIQARTAARLAGSGSIGNAAGKPSSAVALMRAPSTQAISRDAEDFLDFAMQWRASEAGRADASRAAREQKLLAAWRLHKSSGAAGIAGGGAATTSLVLPAHASVDSARGSGETAGVLSVADADAAVALMVEQGRQDTPAPRAAGPEPFLHSALHAGPELGGGASAEWAAVQDDTAAGASGSPHRYLVAPTAGSPHSAAAGGMAATAAASPSAAAETGASKQAASAAAAAAPASDGAEGHNRGAVGDDDEEEEEEEEEAAVAQPGAPRAPQPDAGERPIGLACRCCAWGRVLACFFGCIVWCTGGGMGMGAGDGGTALDRDTSDMPSNAAGGHHRRGRKSGYVAAQWVMRSLALLAGLFAQLAAALLVVIIGFQVSLQQASHRTRVSGGLASGLIFVIGGLLVVTVSLFGMRVLARSPRQPLKLGMDVTTGLPTSATWLLTGLVLQLAMILSVAIPSLPFGWTAFGIGVCLQLLPFGLLLLGNWLARKLQSKLSTTLRATPSPSDFMWRAVSSILQSEEQGKLAAAARSLNPLDRHTEEWRAVAAFAATGELSHNVLERKEVDRQQRKSEVLSWYELTGPRRLALALAWCFLALYVAAALYFCLLYIAKFSQEQVISWTEVVVIAILQDALVTSPAVALVLALYNLLFSLWSDTSDSGVVSSCAHVADIAEYSEAEYKAVTVRRLARLVSRRPPGEQLPTEEVASVVVRPPSLADIGIHRGHSLTIADLLINNSRGLDAVRLVSSMVDEEGSLSKVRGRTAQQLAARQAVGVAVRRFREARAIARVNANERVDPAELQAIPVPGQPSAMPSPPQPASPVRAKEEGAAGGQGEDQGSTGGSDSLVLETAEGDRGGATGDLAGDEGRGESPATAEFDEGSDGEDGDLEGGDGGKGAIDADTPLNAEVASASIPRGFQCDPSPADPAEAGPAAQPIAAASKEEEEDEDGNEGSKEEEEDEAKRPVTGSGVVLETGLPAPPLQARASTQAVDDEEDDNDSVAGDRGVEERPLQDADDQVRPFGDVAGPMPGPLMREASLPLELQSLGSSDAESDTSSVGEGFWDAHTSPVARSRPSSAAGGGGGGGAGGGGRGSGGSSRFFAPLPSAADDSADPDERGVRSQVLVRSPSPPAEERLSGRRGYDAAAVLGTAGTIEGWIGPSQGLAPSPVALSRAKSFRTQGRVIQAEVGGGQDVELLAEARVVGCENGINPSGSAEPWYILQSRWGLLKSEPVAAVGGQQAWQEGAGAAAALAGGDLAASGTMMSWAPWIRVHRRMSHLRETLRRVKLDLAALGQRQAVTKASRAAILQGVQGSTRRWRPATGMPSAQELAQVAAASLPSTRADLTATADDAGRRLELVAELSALLQRLCNVPAVADHPLFRALCGWVGPAAREGYSRTGLGASAAIPYAPSLASREVSFLANLQPFGVSHTGQLRLKRGGLEGVYVQEKREGAHRAPRGRVVVRTIDPTKPVGSSAIAAGVAVGSILTRVNGAYCIAQGVDVVERLLAVEQDPVMLHFLLPEG